MAEEKKDKVQDFEEGPAAQAMVSLSQALLAPLDSIFKAQIHAARSFLNLLLQLGYGHRWFLSSWPFPPPRVRPSFSCCNSPSATPPPTAWSWQSPRAAARRIGHA